MTELTTPRLRLFIWLISAHTALLIASNAGGAKMVALFGSLSASATALSYAITFPICDIINELFGTRAARMTVNVGLAGLVISVVFFQLAIAAPSAPFWNNQDAYVATLGLGPRILIGGWLSYIIGNHVDVFVFQSIKRLTGEPYFWIRKNVSTAVSQAIDTVIFMGIAFGGVFPIAGAIPGQYLVKLFIAIACTPISYLILSMARSHLDKKGKDS